MINKIEKNKKNLHCFAMLPFIVFLASCATPENQGYSEEKASQMSVEMLRNQVLKYKAEVETENARTYKLFTEECPDIYNLIMDNTPYTSSMSKIFEELCPKTAKAMMRLGESLVNYYSFYEKLEEKGGDMTDLEIDRKPFNHLELLFPPIQKHRNPHSDSEEKKPV